MNESGEADAFLNCGNEEGNNEVSALDLDVSSSQ